MPRGMRQKIEMVKYIPHQYQKWMTDRVIKDKAVGLFLDCGLGKTVITLTAIRYLYGFGEIKKVLVIAPLRVAEDTWTTEAGKWEHLKKLRISKILGNEFDRLDGLLNRADVYVINRENVEWLVKLYGRKWPFDMVVIDELSSFKNNQSKRFKALKKILSRVERIVGLTGTPAPNGLMDLWPQVYLLDRGERLGWTIGEFRNRYFYSGAKNGHIVYDWLLRDGAEQSIHETLSDLCVSMKAEDWLELPERIDVEVKVQLTESQRKAYKQLERDLILAISEESNIVASTAAVLSNKLLQFANGTIYDDAGTPKLIHKEKIKALERIVEKASGKPILIFYTYKHDRASIEKHFPGAKQLESSEDIAAWNRGEIPLMIAHPASAGHGLNLQAGGNIIVWFGLPWSLELYQQANARLHRQGQTERVIIHHLIAAGTMDEVVMEALANKAKGQDALLEAVKARIAEYGEV